MNKKISELKEPIDKPTTEELLKEYEYYSRLNNSLDRANAILDKHLKSVIIS